MVGVYTIITSSFPLNHATTGTLSTLEGIVSWLRRKAMHLFIHKEKDAELPIRSLLRMIDTG